MITKQFTFFFLLVTIALVAISIVAALALREATFEYDLGNVGAVLTVIVEQAAEKIHLQETNVQFWADEVVRELILVVEVTQVWCDFIDASILRGDAG